MLIQFRDQLFSIKYRLFCKPIPILLLGLFYFPETLLCQINSRHDPFDWVIYRKPGTIKSFTEGLSYIYIATESAHGIAQLSIDSNIPVIYGIITTDNMKQALDRSKNDSSNNSNGANDTTK